MKRILIFMVASLLIASAANAQYITRLAKDSVVNGATKYVTFKSTPTGVTGFGLTGIKAATGGGTVSGYAILQVRIDTLPLSTTSDWDDYVYPGTTKRDTLFFTDLTTPQAYPWPVPTKFFNGARFKVVTSGTQKLYLYGVYFKP